MLIGYMRVSTADQSLDLQRDALEKAGCERIYDDVCSGRATERPGLARALEVARAGDALAVWKLDRIGRSLPHIVQLVSDLRARDVGLKVRGLSSSGAGNRHKPLLTARPARLSSDRAEA